MENRVLQHIRIVLPLTIGFFAFTDNFPVLAQLTPDNTLGAENSTVTVEQFRDLIRGGAIRGNALFHSFEEFNVNELGQNGQIKSVFFDLQNNGNILNILTRVTGNSSSQILGTLGVLNDLGNANLFLLNPNGITFGANASLQLNGSFFATTADGFGFDNFTFSASGEEVPPPLLTVSIPRFASFRDSPGDIAVNQSNLSVNQGQNLTLVGGNITVEGGQINAPGGRIELAGMYGEGSVTLNDDLSLVLSDLVAPDSGSFELAETNVTDTGTVTINADTLTLSNGVQIVSQTGNGTELGGITINATDSVNVNNGSQIRTQIDGTGNAEGITINAPNILVDGRRSFILVQALSNSSSIANAGNLEINTNFLTVSNRGIIRTLSSGAGNVGDININASEAVQFIDDGSLIALVRGSGNLGNVTINSPNITIDTGGDIFLQVGTSIRDFSEENIQATGNVGNLEINAENFVMEGGSRIRVRTFGPGSIGNVIIDADQLSISSFDSGFFTSSGITLQVGNDPDNSFVINVINEDSPVNLSATGSIGRLEINTRTLNLDGGNQSSVDEDLRSSIQALTWGEGNIGDTIVDSDGNSNFVSININANESVILNSESSIFNQTSASGKVGNIAINTPFLSLINSRISANTSGNSNAGNINIDVSGTFTIDGEDSGIFATASEDATGNPGNLTIESSQLLIQNGAQISFANAVVSFVTEENTSSTDGDTSDSQSNPDDPNDRGNNPDNPENKQPTPKIEFRIVDVLSENFSGNAGTISITSDNLTLQNSGLISAEDNSGAGGTINVQVEDLILLNDSEISAAGQTEGRIQLGTTALVLIEGSSITVGSDNLATFIVDAESRFISEDSTISVGGTNFNNAFNTPVFVTPTVKVETIEPDQQITQTTCYDFGGDSQLSNTGRGGIPQIPGLVVRNSVINVDLVDEVLLPPPPPEAIKPHHRTDVTFLDSEGEEFKPAMGAVLLPNGMVQFVDYNPAEVYRDMYAAAGCNRLSNE